VNGSTLLRRVYLVLQPRVIVVVVVALVVEVGLRISTVPRLARLLGVRLERDGQSGQQLPAGSTNDPPVLWIREQYTTVARVMPHWPFGNTCLRRALVLGHRLRRLEPALVIGVRHDEAGQLAAHAWLVVAGVVLDPLAEQYAPLRDLS
jgi:hypothetical protein